MNKPLYIIIFIISLCCKSKAQTNLVPNGSFELYDTCPDIQNKMKYCNKWFDPTYTSSDYFNNCDVTLNVGVPFNFAGQKHAYHGNAYCGFLTYYPSLSNCREYICTKLNENLHSNQIYTFNAYVALSSNSQYSSRDIGILIKTDTIGLYSFFQKNINNMPDVNFGINLLDTNWTKMTFTFTPKSGGSFLIIGNFFDDLNTQKNIQNLNNSIEGAYCYIDSVSIVKLQTEGKTNDEFQITQIITPNNDSNNDVFMIDFSKFLEKDFSVQIFNRWGNQVFVSNQTNFRWDGTYKNQKLPTSTYFVLINAVKIDNSNFLYKGFIQLVN